MRDRSLSDARKVIYNNPQLVFMRDYSQLLRDKIDAIAQQWVEAVAKDRQIASADNLSESAIKNHINDVLTALVTVLAQSQDSDIKTIVEASFSHGSLRAAQGFAPTEIAREYHLLRITILANLQPELLKGTAADVLWTISALDNVVDTAISHCFKSYVSERVKELEQVENQLNLTVQELSRSVRASQDNISLLAHELKTPLSSIIGYADLYLRQSRLSKSKDALPNLEHIERVLRSGRQLLHLINDALELSRHAAGKMTVQPAWTNLYSLINTVVQVTQPLVESRGLQLLCDCNQGPIQVLTDPLRLQQIVMNLVSNAIRYTETGSVTIETRLLADERWLLAVTDTGIGINEADRSHIFEPFSRAKLSSKPAPTDSTGLGLTITSRLVELLQGEISLSSEVGIGSKFTVILPLKIKVEEDL